MIWCVVFIALFCGFVWKCLGDTESISGKIIWMFFSIAVGVLVGVLLSLVIGTFLPKEWIPSGSFELAKLRDSAGLETKFFLATGARDSRDCGAVYLFRKKGNSRPESISVGSASVYQDENRKDAVAKTYKGIFAARHSYWFALQKKSERYEFYIPTGAWDGSLKEYK